MNNENITISKKAGTIAITSQAEPANPTLTYSSISESWVRRNGNVLTIDANTGSSNRSFSLSVTATTIEDAAYDGIATDSKTFIITQNGTGSTPTGTYELVITLRSDIASITAEQVEFALFEYNSAAGYTRVSDIKSFFADELPTVTETIIDLTGLTSATTYQIMLRPVCSETGWCGSSTDIVQCDYTYPIGGSENHLGTGSIITDGTGDGWTGCGNKFTLSDAHSSNGVVVIELNIR